MKIHQLIKSIFLYSVIPLSIYILLKHIFEKIFENYIIDPIFSKIYPEDWKFDIVIVVLFLSVFLLIGNKLINRATVSFNLFLSCLTIIIIYIFYRFFYYSQFEFTGLKFNKTIKLLDLFFLIPIIIISYFIIEIIIKRTKNKKESTKNDDTLGFSVDEPIILNENNDILFRNKFIDHVACKILNTESKNGSFAIGIVGKWGYGKTTFLESLINRFRNNLIIIELNVWKCNNNTQIIETLFKELRNELSAYSFTIDNKIKDYSLSLLKNGKNEFVTIVNSISELLFTNSSLSYQYKSINDEIKRINKKIIITFDDLDRLDKKEIYEVIRLIRNTANFSNTFFIVTYDRAYLINAIKEINDYQSNYFLEKIFQVEFYLPPIDEIILERELGTRIKPVLTPIGNDGFNKMKQKKLAFNEYAYVDNTVLFIKNIRDIVRFINSIKLSYDFVKDEVYFRDYYNLELIRFKHPELFSMLYNERNSIFTTEDNSNNSFYQYRLERITSSENNVGETSLKQIIEKNKSELKLTNEDIENVCSSIEAIFINRDVLLFDSRQEEFNSHLSVIIPSMFDRYFLLGLNGKLSQVEFSKIRQLKCEVFISRLKHLAKTDDLKIEIKDRLEMFRQFDNREDFEKIISALVLVGNMKTNDNTNIIGFNLKYAAELLGNENIVKKYYSGERSDYKMFLKSIFTEKDEENLFTIEFLDYLLRDGYYVIKNYFDSDDISEMLFINFQNILSCCNQFNQNLWYNFLFCNILIERPLKNNTINISYVFSEKAKKLLQRFLLKNDIDNFINYAFSKNHSIPDEFYINTIIYDIFGSLKFFVRVLKYFKINSNIVNEFLNIINNNSIIDNRNILIPKDSFQYINPYWK